MLFSSTINTVIWLFKIIEQEQQNDPPSAFKSTNAEWTEIYRRLLYTGVQEPFKNWLFCNLLISFEIGFLFFLLDRKVFRFLYELKNQY